MTTQVIVNMEEEEALMDLLAVEFCDEVLSGIGRVLTPRDRPQVPAGKEFFTNSLT